MRTKLSCVVVCVPHHLQYLGECLHDIAGQSLSFDEVIVVVSGFRKRGVLRMHLNSLIETWSAQVNLHLITTRRSTAGKKRNIGANASTGEILFFLDADDRYHPKRNEILEKLFSKNCDAVLHSYIFTEESDSLDFEQLARWLDYDMSLSQAELIFQNELFGATFPNNSRERQKEMLGAASMVELPAPYKGTGIIHGHLTIRRSTFFQIGGFHSYYYPRNEDSVFARDILWSTMSLCFLNAKLSAYRKSSSTSLLGLRSRIQFSPVFACLRFAQYYISKLTR